MTVVIQLNGGPREVPQGCTVAELVVQLGLTETQVAVELNRGILPRPRHATTELAAGDRVEVVTLVGGG